MATTTAHPSNPPAEKTPGGPKPALPTPTFELATAGDPFPAFTVTTGVPNGGPAITLVTADPRLTLTPKGN